MAGANEFKLESCPVSCLDENNIQTNFFFTVVKTNPPTFVKSMLKVTHFLLPVGGAITLTHNSQICAIGLLQRTHC